MLRFDPARHRGGNHWGGTHHLGAIKKKVDVAPEAKLQVSLFQPDLPLNSNSVEVVIDGQSQEGEGAESVDLMIEPTALTRLAADRIATRNTHGTGCTLSSAIAAGLAKGLSLAEAVRAAKSYVTDALAAAERIKIGTGHGPVHHFQAWW